MRRGSSSGPSELTTNATSTFAASGWESDVLPAAERTIALRRGSTDRICEPASPTEAPVATSTPSWRGGPGRLARTVPCTVRKSNAPRWTATTRAAVRPDSRLSARSAFQPSSPRSNDGNAVLLPRQRYAKSAARRPRPEGEASRRLGQEDREGGARNRHVSNLLVPGGRDVAKGRPRGGRGKASATRASSSSKKDWLRYEP